MSLAEAVPLKNHVYVSVALSLSKVNHIDGKTSGESGCPGGIQGQIWQMYLPPVPLELCGRGQVKLEDSSL